MKEILLNVESKEIRLAVLKSGTLFDLTVERDQAGAEYRNRQDAINRTTKRITYVRHVQHASVKSLEAGGPQRELPDVQPIPGHQRCAVRGTQTLLCHKGITRPLLRDAGVEHGVHRAGVEQEGDRFVTVQVTDQKRKVA